MTKDLIPSDNIPEVIRFLRTREYKFLKKLGQGSCGVTVLLHDDVIDEVFVCKKYSPFSEKYKETLFANFVKEIKLLFLINHPNIVRVFNYYIYPEVLAGYILMEAVQGQEIDNYLKENPENINEVFIQTINGFAYLEQNNILHRDIRPQNIMVDREGVVKIIDFGFGKFIHNTNDYGKSITLNWIYETPDEFSSNTYNFKTEIYFLGQLFKKIISELNITTFKFTKELSNMCNKDPDKRSPSFDKVKTSIIDSKASDIEFTEHERSAYINFSNNLEWAISKIIQSARYQSDIKAILLSLELLYKKCMLEDYVHDIAKLLNCFLEGRYYYRSKYKFETYLLRDFLSLLKHSNNEKQNIILNNIHTRLDGIQRYEDKATEKRQDEDVPF